MSLRVHKYDEDKMFTEKKDRAYPVIPADREDDLHNLEVAEVADLVLFMAGNQFMVMEELLEAFQSKCPEVKKIFYETLPPGLELKQILAGGAMFGDKLIEVCPDVYTSVSEAAMKQLEQKDLTSPESYLLYLHNRIVLMVPEGNPAQITAVEDLARSEVRISQPNPEYEDIAFHILDMYRQAGGEPLVQRIMEEKRAEGSTILTVVHHRETPLKIRRGTVDVGPVWATEIQHAQQTELAVDMVDPGEGLDQREKINYYICILKDSANPENAAKFLEFIKSPTAQGIYQRYGFVPHFSTL
jgi:molybdate transport system substrate-binding protein